MKYKCTDLIASWIYYLQGRIQDFKLGGGGGGGGGALKKLPRAEGGAKILRVFRVKNHVFTPKQFFFFHF